MLHMDRVGVTSDPDLKKKWIHNQMTLVTEFYPIFLKSPTTTKHLHQHFQALDHSTGWASSVTSGTHTLPVSRWLAKNGSFWLGKWTGAGLQDTESGGKSKPTRSPEEVLRTELSCQGQRMRWLPPRAPNAVQHPLLRSPQLVSAILHAVGSLPSGINIFFFLFQILKQAGQFWEIEQKYHKNVPESRQ